MRTSHLYAKVTALLCTAAGLAGIWCVVVEGDTAIGSALFLPALTTLLRVQDDDGESDDSKSGEKESHTDPFDDPNFFDEDF